MSHDKFKRILKKVEENNEIDHSINPKMWVNTWLKRQEVTIDYNERVHWDRYRSATMKLLVEYMIEEYFCEMEGLNVKKSDRFSDTDLKRGLYLCIVDIQEEHKDKFIETIRFDKDLDPDLSELRKFCKCLAENDHFTFYALQHFMWQVKRKIFSQSVDDHMMIILRGEQGCGKTRALSEFLAPLKDYVYEGPVHSVQDKNEFHNYNKNYVARCEELERIDKTDKNALKSMITRDTIPYRIMYSQLTAVVDQNCTFIGTSNDDITDLFRDYSGMRRFIQIDTRSKADLRQFWKEINNLNYSKMWKSIAHGPKSPIIAIMEDGTLSTHQESLTPKTSTQEWLSEVDIQPGHNEVDIHVLYNLYKSWCFAIKMKPARPNYFSRELFGAGFIKERRSVGGKKVTIYGCNKQLGGS
jgi:predicted P-loop ATPase